MKNSIDVLKQIYKPYRYTIMGKCTLLESTSGDIIIKEKGKCNISSLYGYLKSRNFNNFPKLIEDNRSDVNVFEYVNDIDMPKDQKIDDLIDVVAALHNKTSYSKEVTLDKFKEIYENIMANILYKEEFYNNLIRALESDVFSSPSSQLLLVHSNKIFASLDFCKRELEKWYSLVKEKKKQRVSLVHNNLKLEHFIKNENDYLISWDNAKVDTPIIDMVELYRNECLNFDFTEKLDKYLGMYNISEDEKILFYILIIIPDEINLNNKEIDNVKIVRCLVDYIYKTEDLIRFYYSKDKEN